jgi:hypothetical protein
MAVPKTAVDENYGPKFWQHNVGAARQIRPMDPKAVASPMEGLSDANLRNGVLRPDTRHHPAAGGPVNYVNHWRPDEIGGYGLSLNFVSSQSSTAR